MSSSNLFSRMNLLKQTLKKSFEMLILLHTQHANQVFKRFYRQAEGKPYNSISGGGLTSVLDMKILIFKKEGSTSLNITAKNNEVVERLAMISSPILHQHASQQTLSFHDHMAAAKHDKRFSK